MKIHEATEQAYKNGYEDGKRDAVKHAEWENVIGFDGNCYGYCSRCKTPHKAQNPIALKASYRYCRWCGARMDGDGNG